MPLRFSVIIPTYQRRDIVARMVGALERQSFRDFEVIVVVDGSSDGTSEALRRLPLRFPLIVLEQTNSGAAHARNAGAAAASGELLLFLDDDMEAEPALLAEHERSHRDGGDMVVGHLPLHPDSPPTVLTPGVARWAERRRKLLATPRAEFPRAQLQTGQMSISRADFERIGGFDIGFTRGGLFGGEDIDFGYRARKAGLRNVFNAAAISYQYYDVDPATYTRRSREAARAAEELSVKHPERAEELRRPVRQFATTRSRVILGLLASAPPFLSWPLRALAVRLVRRQRVGPRSRMLFFEVQTMERARGARQARRDLRRPQAVVLSYHAISDLSGDPILSEYGVPPGQFAEQLDMLARDGWQFVTLEAVLRALDGRETLPPRSLLLTFDDAYVDLLTDGCPLLAERGIPAVAFAVSDLVGGANDWDAPLGAARLPLLDEEGLRAIAAQGIVVGSHGATHRKLVGLELPELEQEVRSSAARLASLGLAKPAVFAYPHGQWSPEVTAAVQDAGYVAAFTVSPGVIRRSESRYALPRIEVYASDTPRTVRLKVLTAAWPVPWRRRVLRLLRAHNCRPSWHHPTPGGLHRDHQEDDR